MERGRIVGLVGESGCGKSTLARAAVGLVATTSGTVTFEGQPVTALRRRARPAELVRLQLVFQNPYSSLNPRRTIGSQLADGMAVREQSQGARSRAARARRPAGERGRRDRRACSFRRPPGRAAGRRCATRPWRTRSAGGRRSPTGFAQEKAARRRLQRGLDPAVPPDAAARRAGRACTDGEAAAGCPPRSTTRRRGPRRRSRRGRRRTRARRGHA